MKGLKKTGAVMIFAVLLIMSFGIAALASGTNSGGDYSLTVQMQCTNEDGSQSSISKADVSIYRVATTDINEASPTYTPVDIFDIGIDYANMNAGQSNKVAKKLAAIADDKGLEGTRAVADVSGNVKFEHLKAGMYLVKLNGYDSSDNGYRDMEPFLVMVPSPDEEQGWISNVTVMPKIAIVKRGNVTTDPPVEKIVKGNPIKAGHFEFRMKTDDVQNPMPEGSRNGEKVVSIEGAGEKEFGTIVFTEPGTYKYSIEEVNTGENGYSYDAEVYSVKCVVTEKNGMLSLTRTVTDHNGNAVDHATFTNVYSILNTGDNTNVVPMIILIAIAGVGILVVERRKRRIACGKEGRSE